jgi:enoyl-CoA hydratase
MDPSLRWGDREGRELTDDVLISAESGVGRLRLNRPAAIHALTTEMCGAMSEALLRWRSDSNIQAVVIDHAVGRGFCAGGDVVMLAKSGRGDARKAREFFFAEYRLNHLLFTYDKPTIAIMDGITMGGGVGISLPCTHRVATENTRLAMPETGIGLFPDVGGGWYLSRLSGRTGQFMALTGARLDGAECAYLGLATHYVPSSKIEDLVDRIHKAPDRIAGTLGGAADPAPDPRIADNLAAINRAFASDRLEDILAALEADESDWAQKELAALGTKSPMSCKVSLRLLAEGAERESFADEMRAEYALAGRVVQTHDFREGVRALLIDKDNAPQWDPPTPEGVTDAMLDALFASLPRGEQWTPFPETGE